MKPVFLDTSGLVAVANADDHWHAVASERWERLRASRRWLVTTSLVLVEVGDTLSKVRQRPLALAIGDRLRASPRVRIVSLTDDLEAEAWTLFRERPDKEWGMTDCVSIRVMRRLGVDEAFSLDHHFTQAGFTPLIE